MVKFIIFGCGNIGKRLIDYIGKERVAYYCDNNSSLIGNKIFSVEVISFEKLLKLKRENEDLVVFIAIGIPRYRNAVEKQLVYNGVNDFCGLEELEIEPGYYRYMADEIYWKLSDRYYRYRYVIKRLTDHVRAGDYLKKRVDVHHLLPATGKLRKKQLERIIHTKKVLDIIKKECNVDAWIDYGALLGKCRHNGFIPWDDDIDLGIMRDDLEKVIEYFEENYTVFYPLSVFENGKDTLDEFNKSGKKYILEITPYVTRIYAWSNDGLIIPTEFFVWDYYDKSMTINIYQDLIIQAQKIIFLDDGYSNITNKLKECWRNFTTEERNLETILMPGIDHAAQGIKSDFLLKKKDIFPLEEFEFEGMTFKFPHNKERILEFEYGDWDRLPDDIGFNHRGLIDE